MGFGVLSSGFRVAGLWLRVQGCGLRFVDQLVHGEEKAAAVARLCGEERDVVHGEPRRPRDREDVQILVRHEHRHVRVDPHLELQPGDVRVARRAPLHAHRIRGARCTVPERVSPEPLLVRIRRTHTARLEGGASCGVEVGPGGAGGADARAVAFLVCPRGTGGARPAVVADVTRVAEAVGDIGGAFEREGVCRARGAAR